MRIQVFMNKVARGIMLAYIVILIANFILRVTLAVIMRDFLAICIFVLGTAIFLIWARYRGYGSISLETFRSLGERRTR